MHGVLMPQCFPMAIYLNCSGPEGLALERKDPNGGDPPGRYELQYSEAQPMYEPVAKASGAHKS